MLPLRKLLSPVQAAMFPFREKEQLTVIIPADMAHQTLVQGTMNSCNPFFIYLGQLLGTETFFDYFEAFGFTQKTGIDLPGESQSIYHDRDMSLMDLAVESFGQNFSITPIQMITACAACKRRLFGAASCCKSNCR